MKILFYAPHSAIWVHAFPEALVAESLAKSGHEVVYVTCGAVFRRQCVAMSAAGVRIGDAQERKDAVCGDCQARKRLLRSKFAFQGYDLADVLTDADRKKARRLCESLTREGFPELEVDGIPLGRIALYEFLLDRKKGTLDMDDGEWRDYRVHLENALLAHFASDRVLEREHPDRVVVYNALYSVNRAMCELAEQRSIPTYFLHAGLNFSRRLQTLLLGRRNSFRYYEELLAAWPRFRTLPCDARVMQEITDHFMVLFAGSSPFGYSSAMRTGARPVRERLGIRAEQKILVAAMSSYDERFAAEATGALPPARAPVFPTQVEWIEALLQYVSRRPDLFLVIRVHPRDFPNKRESVMSDHARMLETLLRDLPPNVAVNWPRDQVSLFELASEASVLLNAWSAAGKEVSILGIPVVLYAPTLVAYPPDLNFFGATKEAYFNTIESALEEGWSAERARMTFRWLAVEYGYGLISIADAYRQTEVPNRAFGPRILGRLLRMIDPLSRGRLDCVRRPQHLAASGEITAILESLLPTPCSIEGRGTFSLAISNPDETRALRSQLSRISKALFGARGDAAPSLLERNMSTFIGGEA